MINSILAAAMLFSLAPMNAQDVTDAGGAAQTPGLYFGRRLEPQAGRILHGAGQDPKAFAEYFKLLREHPPAIYMDYFSLEKDAAGFFKKLQKRLAKYPVYLIPQIGLGMTVGDDPEIPFEREVAIGRLDAKIQAFCDGLRALDRPAFVRMGFEFSGEWNGYQPEPYKQAWIRIVQALRKNKLDQVATLWCYTPDSQNKHYMDYYPGDEYVDWWAIDLFGPEHFTAPDTLAFVRDAKERRFPVMITESTARGVGVLDGARSWESWFAPYFKFMRENPQVKGFCYINWDWTKRTLRWGNGRIGVNPVVLERFRRELSRQGYLHGGSRESTNAALGLGGRSPAGTK